MKKYFVAILITLIASETYSQSYKLFSGYGALNNNYSQISPLTGLNLLSEKNTFNSVKIGAAGGLRLSSGIGITLGASYLNQRWNFEDRTSSELTTNKDFIKFKNKMSYVALNTEVHKTFEINGELLGYVALAFDLSFMKTGDYWNDVNGNMVYEWRANYNNSLNTNIRPEIGYFFKVTDNSEWSVFAHYNIGNSEMYAMNYRMHGDGNNESYDINSKGNQIGAGIKYTYKIPMSKKEPKEKKVKEPKPEKEPKVKEPKPAKEPKPKKVKEPKVKEDKNPKKELPTENIIKFNEKGIPEDILGRTITSEGKSLEVTSLDIEIHVWDHQRVDNDTVSLYFNGEWVLKEHRLLNDKKIVKLKLDENGNNYLILYAHNLGEVPPNTAAVIVYDGKTYQRIVLNADMKSSEALNITYKKKE